MSDFKNGTQIVVAPVGKFLETLRVHAGTSVAVLAGEYDWSDVVASADPFEAIIQFAPRTQLNLSDALYAAKGGANAPR